MEIGVALIKGLLLGMRNFEATEDVPYNEVQLFAGPLCIYIIWD
tara:strand:- start:161 stop:292 length:132 start_codon:yes stop_codon:yes gene_type:complete